MTVRRRAVRAAWLLAAATLVASASAPAAARAEEPRLAAERVVLHTRLGDLVLALYPDVAPRHVAQIIRLVRLGAYDTTYFYRVDPTFIAQLSTAQARRQPLTPEQSAAIIPIAAEFSDLRHVRGVLSMAREDGRPDSAETSFSILYAPAPHLDGKYTIFGRLESGEDVLNAIATVPRDAENRPLDPIEVVHAEVADSPEALARVVRPSVPVAQGQISSSSGSPMMAVARPGGDGRPAAPFLVLVAAMMACGLGSFVLAGRAPARLVGSLGLLTTMLGAFLLFTTLVPVSASSPWLALGLFAGSIALFKLMSRFESEPPTRRPAPRADAPRSPRSAA
jgi:peptidylprolyl isomerase